METAGAMHRAMMPHPGAYNLFYLGETLEQKLTRIIHRQKVPVSGFPDFEIHIEEMLDWLPAEEGLADWTAFLANKLGGRKPDPRTLVSWQKKVVSGTVGVDENIEAPVAGAQLAALLNRLLAGYAIGGPGKLIMPYFTVKGNDALSLPVGGMEAAG